MSNYKLYAETTAPEGARQTLQEVKSNFGFIPNLMATMAESPAFETLYYEDYVLGFAMAGGEYRVSELKQYLSDRGVKIRMRW